MSVPELFHHQHRFIGCLAIRRVSRLQPGDRISRRAAVRADEDDAAAYSRLAGAVLHRLAGTSSGHDVLLAGQAFPSSPTDRCPALGGDLRCTVHQDRKPAACSVVPLDALVPDRLQHAVLADRAGEALYMGADCIAPGERAGFAPFTRQRAVIDDGARGALARRRADLVDEKRWWGDAVFRLLHEELFAHEGALSRVPVSAHLVMSIAPALMVIARASPPCRARCLEYAEAQSALMADAMRGWTARRSLVEPPLTQQLRAFARTNAAMQAALARAPARATDGAFDPREAFAIETWLGLTPEPQATSQA
jgi:hypothetical protein